ncbi:hypothetical protein B0H03_101395 [Rathayibacter iranicus NCPPB 2253 = VKM Ac-1602]|uniref:Uncharacterized protein n=1 Tax=Rathayibacter iranicus NCPPB 2253 = VKM Ac-1602 TaxID=1328868 RepID=A0ABX5LHJ9_9MICO|nr:hypothetical protein B0H03_101395 [Rathayibacter iranicus NCPPB 2253 = VKM Ac-1602]
MAGCVADQAAERSRRSAPTSEERHLAEQRVLTGAC